MIPTERIVTENGKSLMMLTPGFALVGGAGYGTGLDLGLSMPEGMFNYLASNATGMKNSGLEFINDIGVGAGYGPGKSTGEQLSEALNFDPPEAKVSPIDPKTKTMYIDQDLNYANIGGRPLVGALDVFSLLQLGNIRWTRSGGDAGMKYENALRENGDKIIGISASGINDNGESLDLLTKRLASEAYGSFTITHSAGIEVLLNSNLTTEKVIILSPQAGRERVEAWIDKMGLKKEDVLIVDIVGDLPYHPTGLLDNISVKDLGSPGGLISSVNTYAKNVGDAVGKNAYNDYSLNPNGKYTYVRVVDGFFKEEDNPLIRHGIGINGALSEKRTFTLGINGRAGTVSMTLEEFYIKFLQRKLK
jgi:hypothetical protein